MFIIYNQDGSIKKTNFAEFIQRGNDGANKIFVCIDGEDIQNYTTYALFKLPDGEIGGPINGTQATRTIEGKEYTGYNIPITSAVTMFEGIVHMTLYVANPTTQAILYTYPVVLTINDTQVTPPDLTQINLEQYQQLLNLITQNGYEFLELPANTDNGTLTDDQLELVKGNQTIIKYGFRFLRKYESNGVMILYSDFSHLPSSPSNYKRVAELVIQIIKAAKTWRLVSKDIQFYDKEQADILLNAKQDTLTWDNTPTENSLNPVTSGGIYSAIQAAVTGATEFKGTVADLTTLNAIEDPSAGDMYWVTSEACYYIYNGTIWSAAGGNVDLSNYVDLTSNQTITGTKTFKSSVVLETNNYDYDASIWLSRKNYNNAELGFYINHNEICYFMSATALYNSDLVDLGTSTHKWKDLYLSGSLKDGTNEITIAEITNKAKNWFVEINLTWYSIKDKIQNNNYKFFDYDSISQKYVDKSTEVLNGDYDSVTLYNNLYESMSNINYNTSSYPTVLKYEDSYYMMRREYTPLKHGDLIITLDQNYGTRYWSIGNVARTLCARTRFTEIIGDVTPSTTGQYDIGSSTKKWKDLYLSGKAIFGAGWQLQANNDGTFTIKDNNNNTTLTIVQNGVGEGTISHNRFSPANENLDLGSFGNVWGNYRWRNLYLKGYISDGTNQIAVADIQSKLTFDSTPTTGSTNPVTSKGIRSFVLQNQNTLPIFKHKIKFVVSGSSLESLRTRTLTFLSTISTPFSFNEIAAAGLMGPELVIEPQFVSALLGNRPVLAVKVSRAMDGFDKTKYVVDYIYNLNGTVTWGIEEFYDSNGDTMTDTVTTFQAS